MASRASFGSASDLGVLVQQQRARRRRQVRALSPYPLLTLHTVSLSDASTIYVELGAEL
jgi:hypothetical protein